MRNLHYLVDPIWHQGPYESPEKRVFMIETAHDVAPLPDGTGLQFSLEGRMLAPEIRIEIANQYRRLIAQKPTDGEKPIRFYAQIQFSSPQIVRIQLRESEEGFDRQTEMVIGTFPTPTITMSRKEDIHVVESEIVRVELSENPFKIQIVNKHTGKLVVESQDRIENFIECGWNHASGQIIGEKCKYPKITMFSTKINNNEHFYGTGEMFGSLDKREQRIYLDIQDPTTTDTENHYKAIPFYMSTNNYGVFVTHLMTSRRVRY